MEQYYKNTLQIASQRVAGVPPVVLKDTAPHIATDEGALAKYQAGAMNAIGLLFDYVKVKFKPDWKIVLLPKQVCEELSISNSTFYRALKKVQQLVGKIIYLRQEKAILTYDTEIPTREIPSPTHETKIPTSGNQIPTRGNENPQTASKTSTPSDTPDLNTDLNRRSLSKIEQICPKEREISSFCYG